MDYQRNLLEAIFSAFDEIYGFKLMRAVLNSVDVMDSAIGDRIIKNKVYADLCAHTDKLQNEFITNLNDEQRSIYDTCRSEYIRFQDYSLGNIFRITGEILMQLKKEYLDE